MAELDELLRTLATEGQLVHVERIAARPARTAPLSTPLPPPLDERVPPEGLWTHQAAALEHARSGRSVVVATGTA